MTDRPSLGRQIAEVRAEIAMRGQVFARQVAARKMTQSEADYRIETMTAVLDTLLWCQRHADVIRRVAVEMKAETAEQPAAEVL